MFDDADVDELERRVAELERSVFSSEAADHHPPLWEMIEALEEKIGHLEGTLNPEGFFSPGADCRAFSIADGAWLDAVVNERVGRTYSITFVESGIKRQVVADQIRAINVDVSAVVRAEDAVQALASQRIPSWNPDDSPGFPLAVPLSTTAQQSYVVDAEVKSAALSYGTTSFATTSRCVPCVCQTGGPRQRRSKLFVALRRPPLPLSPR